MRCIQRRRHNSVNVIRNRQKHFNFPIASGPIKFILSGKSFTVGHTEAYNDNHLRLPLININASQAILEACRAILKASLGQAKPYKLSVYRGTEFLFTVRSVFWGSLRTMDEILPNVLFIDRLDLTNQPL